MKPIHSQPGPQMLTVYARKVPGGGVTIWRDKDATRAFCAFVPGRKDKPDKRFKFITLNCYRWKLEWIPSA